MGVWLLNTFRSKPPNTAYIKVLKTKAQFGSATVEAAITLPLVILAFVSVLSIIRITSTYEMIQHSLNQVAVQLSQYTYISTVTGIKPKHDDLQNNLNNAKEEMKARSDAIETFYTSIQSLTSKESWFDIPDSNVMDDVINNMSNIDNIKSSSGEILDGIGYILENPKGELQLIGIALSDNLVSKSKTALLDVITKAMLKNSLSNQLNMDDDYLCKYLGINGGFEQLDLSSSTLFNDNKTIDIIVEYTVKPIPQVFIMPEIKLRNRATVLVWSNGCGSVLQQSSTDEQDSGESLWNVNSNMDARKQHLQRGNKIDKLYAEELKNAVGGRGETTPYNFKTIDLIEYAHSGKDGKLVTIFSLNPFMPTYNKKDAVVGVIEGHLNKLRSFEKYTAGGFTIDLSLLSGDYKRVVYIVIPENNVLPETYLQAFEESKRAAKKMNIELIQVQKYGEYNDGSNVENEGEDSDGKSG